MRTDRRLHRGFKFRLRGTEERPRKEQVCARKQTGLEPDCSISEHEIPNPRDRARPPAAHISISRTLCGVRNDGPTIKRQSLPCLDAVPSLKKKKCGSLGWELP